MEVFCSDQSLVLQETIVVTHRDWSVLPSKMDQREINLLTPILASDPESDHPASARRNRHSQNSLTETNGLSSPLPPSSSPVTPQSPARPDPPERTYFPPRESSVYTMGNHVIQPPASLLWEEVTHPVIQSTNPVVEIAEETILAVARLER
jgi:hypothetical protein